MTTPQWTSTNSEQVVHMYSGSTQNALAGVTKIRLNTATAWPEQATTNRTTKGTNHPIGTDQPPSYNGQGGSRDGERHVGL